MLLHLILFCVVLQSVTSSFPSYIKRCPLPNPNVGNCILNNAIYALPYLQADPNFNLPNHNPLYLNDDILQLADNSEIKLNGIVQPDPDSYLSEASVDLNSHFWIIGVGGTSLTSSFDFILTINEDNDEKFQVKGQITVFQDNWKIYYTGNYMTKEIDNANRMQIGWSWAYLVDDTFEVNYIGITTLDDQPLTRTENTKVKKALRNFERAFQWKCAEEAKDGITLSLNTVLVLVREDEVFKPVPDPCAEEE